TRRSSDLTWQMLSTPAMCCWFDGDLAIHPFDVNTLFIAVVGAPQFADGIYKSIDGGSSWTRISDGLPTQQFHTLAIDPNNPAVIFAGTRGTSFPGPPPFDSGVYRSLDGGVTWMRLTSGLPSQMKPTQVVVSPWDSSIVYVSAAGWPGGQGGVYKSVDGGDHFIEVLQENVFAVAVGPFDSNIVHAGTYNTGGFYRSEDGGATWRPFNRGLPVQAGIAAITLDLNQPGRVLLGTSAGVYEARFAFPADRGAQATAHALPSPVAFGIQPLNAVRTETVTVEFTNGGGHDVPGGRLVGADASQFSFDLSGCAGGTGESSSCAVTVSFAPTTEGLKSAVLEIDVRPGPSPLRVFVSGTGLSAAHRIVGRVLDGFTRRPLANARVIITGMPGPNVIAHTDADGTYFTPELDDGSYRVSTSTTGYLNLLFAGLPCADTCDLAAGTAITLPAVGTPITADFILFRRTSIFGIVQATDAPPLAGVSVRLLDQAGGFVRDTTTDAAGRFAFLELNEGFYFARTLNTLGYSDSFSDVLSTPFGTSMAFTLAPNTRTGAFVNAQPSLADGSTPASVNFRNVSVEGKTTITAGAPDAPPLPPQYSATNPSVAYRLQTTATFDSGVRTCFSYQASAFQNGNQARVLQLQNGAWVD